MNVDDTHQRWEMQAMVTNNAGGPYNDALQAQVRPEYDFRTKKEKSPVTQDYYGTKRITAWPADGKDGQPGYGVKYADGYTSWSPKEAFEAAYQPLNALSFGHALVALKEGKRVARAGWNGKGMFLYYVPANKYPASGNTLGTMKGVFPDDMVPYGAYIAMKTAQENVVPWLASQTDVLADDWVVLE